MRLPNITTPGMSNSTLAGLNAVESSSSLLDLPADLLCRIALGPQPDELPPAPPCETVLSLKFNDYGREARRLERERNEQRLALAWEEFRARRQWVAAFRCVCQAWRAALTEGVTCLPTWLSPEAALHPMGPWKERLRTLCLAVPGRVLHDHPDLDSWQQQLTGELHALYPNLLHLHFRVIDLMPRLNFLVWHIGWTDEADGSPMWQGFNPAADNTARDMPSLVLDTELLTESTVRVDFRFKVYEWARPSAIDYGLEVQGPLTLRALMPVLERHFLRKFPEISEQGGTEHLTFVGLKHEGGGFLLMTTDFWTS